MVYKGNLRSGAIAEGRWLQSNPGRGWFVYFRIYGPEEAAFDGSWRLGDFQRLS